MQFEVSHWLALAGAAATGIAFLAYFLGGAKARVPGTIGGVLGGLLLGTGVGMIGSTFFGYSLAAPDPGHMVGRPVVQNPKSWAPPKGLGGPPPMKPPEGSKMPEGMKGGPGGGFAKPAIPESKPAPSRE